MSQFEIELRGLLTPSQRKKLESFLNTNGEKVKEYKRTHWCFKSSLKDKAKLYVHLRGGRDMVNRYFME